MQDDDHDPRVVRARSIFGIVIGYLVFGISAAVLFGVSGQDPRVFPPLPFLLFSTIYGMCFAMLAGFVAVRIGTARSGVDVAALIAVIAIVSLILEWRAGSIWSEAAVLVFMVPAAVIGGGLVHARIE